MFKQKNTGQAYFLLALGKVYRINHVTLTLVALTNKPWKIYNHWYSFSYSQLCWILDDPDAIQILVKGKKGSGRYQSKECIIESCN